ncbi:hypothetical protein B0H10DRAFT_1949190 [Mycena sp. CBHHK59/15]|nr:hypothetical protein B0H10DRAFT_1949190 [Mycena sp. CBHHK59/15]
MRFTRAAIISASLGGVIVSSVFGAPSATNVVAGLSPNAEKVLTQVTNVANSLVTVQRTMSSVAALHPNNHAVIGAVNNVHSIVSSVAPISSAGPLSGVVGSCLNGDSGLLRGLLPGDTLNVLLTGSTVGLVSSLLGGGGGGLLGGLLGSGLLGGLDPSSLGGLVAKLLASLDGLSGGCGCSVGLLDALISAVLELVSDLLGLLSAGQSCGCGFDPALVGPVTALLSGVHRV